MHSDDGQTHRPKTDAIADLPQSASTDASHVAEQVKGGASNAMKPKGDSDVTITQNTK